MCLYKILPNLTCNGITLGYKVKCALNLQMVGNNKENKNALQMLEL